MGRISYLLQTGFVGPTIAALALCAYLLANWQGVWKGVQDLWAAGFTQTVAGVLLVLLGGVLALLLLVFGSRLTEYIQDRRSRRRGHIVETVALRIAVRALVRSTPHRTDYQTKLDELLKTEDMPEDWRREIQLALFDYRS